MEHKHQFGWGDPRGVREVMLKHAGFLYMMAQPLRSYGYPNHEGNADLIVELRKLIKDLIGKDYKHVLVTQGGTHGINAYIHAKKSLLSDHFSDILTHNLYFPFYPGIAKNHDLFHSTADVVSPTAWQIGINASPDNPLGEIHSETQSKNVLFDAAYYSPTYAGIRRRGKLENVEMHPEHGAIVGSLNKLTGISGLRLGYLATDDTALYEKALEYVTHDVCGVSWPSQYLATQILKKVNLDVFYVESKALLDTNREEIAKLGKIFGHQDISDFGMFAFWEADKRLQKLLEKASVKVMDGRSCGANYDSIRINLANTITATEEMVQAVIKADKR